MAARRYTGVADYDDYRGVPADRYNGFWDPDEAPPGGGPYAAFPRYPGLLERAQAAFSGRGARRAVVHRARQPRRADPGQRAGQHRPVPVDRRRLPEGLPVGGVDPARFSNADSESEVFEQIADPSFIQTLLAGARPVPPDPDRRIISTEEYKREIGGSHGYRHVEAAERRASDGVATYYAFRPRAAASS